MKTYEIWLFPLGDTSKQPVAYKQNGEPLVYSNRKAADDVAKYMTKQSIHKYFSKEIGGEPDKDPSAMTPEQEKRLARILHGEPEREVVKPRPDNPQTSRDANETVEKAHQHEMIYKYMLTVGPCTSDDVDAALFPKRGAAYRRFSEMRRLGMLVFVTNSDGSKVVRPTRTGRLAYVHEAIPEHLWEPVPLTREEGIMKRATNMRFALSTFIVAYEATDPTTRESLLHDAWIKACAALGVKNEKKENGAE